MNKKLLALVLALIMVVGLFPSLAQAATTYDVEFVPDHYWKYSDYRDSWFYSDLDFIIYDLEGNHYKTTSNYTSLPNGDYTVNVKYGSRVVGHARFYVNGEDKTVYVDTAGYDFDWYYYRDRYPYRYKDSYYPYYTGEVYNVNVYSSKITGEAKPFSTVKLYYDGTRMATTTADKNGNFIVYYDFDKYYDYKYDYKYWYDLDKFYLTSDDGSRYYLTSYYVVDKGYWPTDKKYVGNFVSPAVITDANAGAYYVAGKSATAFADISIRDNGGNLIGSGVADSAGKFTINVNRALVAGEPLQITTAHKNYMDLTKTIIVSGVPERFNYTTKFVIGSKDYSKIVNGKTTPAQMDVAPYIENGRTMLPIRYVAESLGYSVNWDEETKNAVFIKGSKTAVINLNSRDFYVNAYKHTLSVEPITVNGRIMLPVSELGVALGLTHGYIGEGKNIEWDGPNQTVVIQINN